MAIPAAIGVWELGALAAGGLAGLFVASPQGREAAREAARATAEALEKLRPVPESDAGQRSEPIPRGTTQSCSGQPDCGKEMCPVCGKRPNPMPGVTPAYVHGDLVPQDSETLPPLTSYKRTRIRVQKATVYQRPDKSLVHRDKLHKGKGAEIEVYDRHGRHMGAICPHCGHPRKGPKPGRRLKL
ncbi:hypothetical protein [Candidatus Thiosymbion oneisti]|uniref:hypothetical protein n=1 Tax=Candidatus Thiosymbion oneisti TaxID=589554 RepID=UPI00105EA53A|nr:hypothetical protein [Candidatus Thiosymbion oneisti]